MDRQGKTRRGLRTLVVLVACFMLTGPVMAQGRRSSAAAATLNEDLVTAVDAATSSIELGGTTYRVDSRSRLMDVAGRRIRLGNLSDGRNGGTPDMVAYQVAPGARKGAPGRIVSLRVLEGDFE